MKDILRDKIESKVWKPDDLIDSEHQLMAQYKVSRNTVKKAIEDLVQEGLLNRVQGKGTFVSRPKIEHSLGGFYSFSKVLKAKGIEARDVVLSVEPKLCLPSIAGYLKISVGETVHELKRLRYAGNDPIIFETSYIPARIAEHIQESDLNNIGLYDLLQEKYNVSVVKAKESFEPVLIDKYESTMLHVKEGYPALLLDRIAFDISETPIEYCRSIVRGDRCKFYTELL
ncbi:GntR family transcriptional regulator [Alicyclobacillus fastidiosus]|uniref:GntR family transcriptional regulator n=1 Tax=Alicyclobacillus fastidiosus TaxID=392011 RepID=A0ABV5AA34_9BACL|nr:GntR family transcriptional regulator [Alicyclobacillus fastidiosus]WEH11996.1 GntR family transcriptional regulator [Alicyclobacillus fastidiosus]